MLLKLIKKLNCFDRLVLFPVAFTVSWVLFHASPATALPAEVSYDTEIIKVSGLSFRCPSCFIQDEQYCGVFHQGITQLLRCEEVPRFFLKALATDSGSFEFPTPAELAAFLLRSPVDPEIGSYIFQLLSRNQAGLEAIVRFGRELLPKYPEEIETLARNSGAQIQVLLPLRAALMVLPAREEKTIRAVFAVLDPDYRLEDLVSELTVTALEEDIQFLTLLKKELGTISNVPVAKLNWASMLEELTRRSSACQTIAASGVIPKACALPEIQQLPAPLASYLQRVQLHHVLAWLEKAPRNSEQVLAIISETNYRAFRTAATHQVILTALQNIDQSHLREAMYREPIITMLGVFAENDSSIRDAYIQFLESGLAWLSKAGGSNDGPTMVRVQAARAKLPSGEGKSARIGTPRVLVLVFLVVAISLLLWSKQSKAGRLRREAEIENRFTSEERNELREIFRYFGLPVWTSEATLQREYRKRAKRLHPDVQTGSEGAFTTLGEKYSRAKQLLARRDIKS